MQTVEGIYRGVCIYQRIKLCELLHFSLSQGGETPPPLIETWKNHFFKFHAFSPVVANIPPSHMKAFSFQIKMKNADRRKGFVDSIKTNELVQTCPC